MRPEFNEKRMWYDKGYSLGVYRTKVEAAVPRLLVVWALAGVVYFDAVAGAVFLLLYTAHTLFGRREDQKAVEVRELPDPGPMFEMDEVDDDG